MKKAFTLILICVTFHCFCNGEATRKFWNASCNILKRNELLTKSSNDTAFLFEAHKESLQAYNSLSRYNVDQRALNHIDNIIEIENEIIAGYTILRRLDAKLEEERKDIRGTANKAVLYLIEGILTNDIQELTERESMEKKAYEILASAQKKMKYYKLSGHRLAEVFDRVYDGGFSRPPIIDWSREEAEDGEPVAQYFLGACYANGKGVPKDTTEAVKWYRKSAEQGLSEAQNDLGRCYANGEGVTKDMTEAVKWFRKSAEQGFALAQYYLGQCYAKGKGVTKDMTEAVKWFRKAAEQGVVEAQAYLGACYAAGEGVSKDMTETVKWFRKSAEQGYALAQFSLGWCYAKGEGVTKDMSEAVKWYRKAAEQGLSVAQNDLGRCYANGEGVTKDMTEAVKWYRKAAEQGFEEAKKALAELKK